MRVVDNETEECDSEFLGGTRNRIGLRYGRFWQMKRNRNYYIRLLKNAHFQTHFQTFPFVPTLNFSFRTNDYYARALVFERTFSIEFESAPFFFINIKRCNAIWIFRYLSRRFSKIRATIQEYFIKGIVNYMPRKLCHGCATVNIEL